MSIKFRVEPGNNEHKTYLTRVSTSGLELVIDRSMTKDSFNSVISLWIEFLRKEEKDLNTLINKLIIENLFIQIHQKNAGV